MILDKEKSDLFDLVRVKCGAPMRDVQIADDALCILLTSCVEDYAMEVQNWIIENQWMSLYGKNINNIDMAFSLSMRSLDLMKDYAQWFSKEVGLQQQGKWELKKDYVTVEAGKQDYIIPSGREINKVLYMTPPVTQAALFANTAGVNMGFGGGGIQAGAGLGGGYGTNAMGGYYIAPAYDTMLMAADLNLKQRLLKSDLVYKVTAGPEGTKILHLLSTPGSRMSFNHSGNYNRMGLGLVGCYVWYTYYDVSGSDVDDCRKQNSDILITPDQVPLDKMDYTFLNEATKILVRKLLVAEAKIHLGIIRGTFDGKVNIPKAELSMDYQMLLNQGLEEKEKVMTELKERLKRMNPEEQMKKQADLVNAMLEVKKGTPLGFYVK